MEKTIKTPLGFQTFVWRDNALARPEDLERAEVIDINELKAQKCKKESPKSSWIILNMTRDLEINQAMWQ